MVCMQAYAYMIGMTCACASSSIKAVMHGVEVTKHLNSWPGFVWRDSEVFLGVLLTITSATVR